ncbi:mucin-5AC-like isoform X2 [Scleropages formosus]|uniref:mucin-5AC-like isoform X2 n=1 Tax=Scleropages formosus TaxID=113540 RepID=UPI0010FA9B4C|nr:mucin-5AC-like isoform X2 [Scleropages formosus]
MSPSLLSTAVIISIIILNYFNQLSEAEGELVKPVVSVNTVSDDRTVTVVCQTNTSMEKKVTCYLYTGDTPEFFISTWTKSTVCHFYIKCDDLERRFQTVGSRNVSCDYSVETDTEHRSPRSDSYSVPASSPGVSTTRCPVTSGTTVIPQSSLMTSNPISETEFPTQVSTASWALTSSTTEIPQSISSTGVSTTSSAPTSGTTVIPQSNSSPEVSTTRSALTSEITATPQSSSISNTTSVTEPPPQGQQVVVGVASAVCVLLLGVTAICLGIKFKKKIIKREQRGPGFLLNDGDTLRIGDTCAPEGTCSIITSISSTPNIQPDGNLMKADKLGTETPGTDETYCIIADPPSCSGSQLFDPVKKGETPEGPLYTVPYEHHVYATIKDQPSASAQQDLVYSLLQKH